jgi:transcription antitermination factor NusG
MNRKRLLKQFHARMRSRDLPFVRDDEVEILSGVYAGKRGVVEEIAVADPLLRFVVDFRDGTDELFELSALKLVTPAA